MGWSKKQVEQLSGYSSAVVGWGLAAFITMVYVTDWKVITAHIPFYNTKYAKPKPKPGAPSCDD